MSRKRSGSLGAAVGQMQALRESAEVPHSEPVAELDPAKPRPPPNKARKARKTARNSLSRQRLIRASPRCGARTWGRWQTPRQRFGTHRRRANTRAAEAI
jgi:hypothetical protein